MATSTGYHHPFTSGDLTTVNNRDIDSDCYVEEDVLRTTFALSMSAMYTAEVPLYGDLVQIVRNINQSKLPSATETERLSLERHGAIRLGTNQELQTVHRIFNLVGMHPVGYYDLSVAGLPMHATCFRPVDGLSLQKNPFRVFTTLLRPDLLRSDDAKSVALSLLRHRRIFSDELMRLLDVAESQGNRLTKSQAETYIIQVLRSFSWHSTAAANYEQYQLLKSEHPILADIACFRSAHINHLTPRTLDITEAQSAMLQAKMAVKSRIEGPPRRKCPILLRQTSFLALEEKIHFPSSSSFYDATLLRDPNDATPLIEGSHKARFGEIEERGAAVTPKGRQLYDRLLELVMQKARSSDTAATVDPHTIDKIMEDCFQVYPDDWDELRKQGLVYYEYRINMSQNTMMRRNAQATFTSNSFDCRSTSLESLICEGIIEAVPITYEDFLPFSAAGIFQSNLGSNKNDKSATERNELNACPDLEGFERALGTQVLDPDVLYAGMQKRSLERCATVLGIRI
ncbi:hypothetical protein BGW36DRAFT_364624 [Talaromyces proteolyticus]|uniref:2-oxoadipate dioxygenase/decarboxylase n=1 Tax=Talaromyces proteolyticus TaxID=1131652 RepID=A0AAD4KJQ6_9EURO|nr:uncharacterized protein BGW36DRAFT_364624 [Talaromyces proteolyticus]KAH8689884.1 hypothetical protein BGW36DRAFT_364624 [Talaromyces proteolyticus]